MSIGRTVVALDTQSRETSRNVSHDVLRPLPDAAAVRAWAAARDAVLRGLVHALSNRVGTVAAVGGMLDGAPPGSLDTAARVLAGEGERLEALLAQFRLATADPFGVDGAAEPLHVGELLGDVAALAAGAALPGSVRVEAAADVRPAVASRAAVVQALLTLAAGEGPVTLRAAAAPAGRVEIAVVPAAGPVAAPAVAAAAWLLGASCEVVADDPGATLFLPALGGS